MIDILPDDIRIVPILVVNWNKGKTFHINRRICLKHTVESIWNVMAQGDGWEGKWRGNSRMEWVASTLHTTSEHGVSSITTADVYTAASSRRNWRPHQFKWTRQFRWKTKFDFCECAITFQTQSNTFGCTERDVLTEGRNSFVRNGQFWATTRDNKFRTWGNIYKMVCSTVLWRVSFLVFNFHLFDVAGLQVAQFIWR